MCWDRIRGTECARRNASVSRRAPIRSATSAQHCRHGYVSGLSAIRAGERAEHSTVQSHRLLHRSRVRTSVLCHLSLYSAISSDLDGYARYEAGAKVLQELATDATTFWEASTGVNGLIPDAWRPLGLSNAQRDLCTQLYLKLLINWGTKESLEEARALVDIRLQSGKDAALSDRLQATLARASL